MDFPDPVFAIHGKAIDGARRTIAFGSNRIRTACTG